MKTNILIIYYVLMMFILSSNFPNRLNAQTDSTLISCKEFKKLNICTWAYEENNKKQKGKFFLKSTESQLNYTLKAMTPIDKITKIHHGYDNFGREYCSIIYQYGRGYQFIAVLKVNDKWQSDSAGSFRFDQLNSEFKIEEITFALFQPKVFKVEYTNSKKSSKIYAEINGKIEWIDCHTCVFR